MVLKLFIRHPLKTKNVFPPLNYDTSIVTHPLVNRYSYNKKPPEKFPGGQQVETPQRYYPLFPGSSCLSEVRKIGIPLKNPYLLLIFVFKIRPEQVELFA